jgi:hypothetical protein
MTTAEIRELMAAGGTVGSHSVSHPYRKRIDAAFKKGAPAGEAFLRMEMKDSRQFLEDLTGQKVTTYAYPGGYHSEREEAVGKECGYEAMFTVNPARVGAVYCDRDGCDGCGVPAGDQFAGDIAGGGGEAVVEEGGRGGAGEHGACAGCDGGGEAAEDCGGCESAERD